MLTGEKNNAIILPDHERYPEHVRNISISMGKANRASGGTIRFHDTLEGLREAER